MTQRSTFVNSAPATVLTEDQLNRLNARCLRELREYYPNEVAAIQARRAKPEITIQRRVEVMAYFSGDVPKSGPIDATTKTQGTACEADSEEPPSAAQTAASKEVSNVDRRSAAHAYRLTLRTLLNPSRTTSQRFGSASSLPTMQATALREERPSNQ